MNNITGLYYNKNFMEFYTTMNQINITIIINIDARSDARSHELFFAKIFLYYAHVYIENQIQNTKLRNTRL